MSDPAAVIAVLAALLFPVAVIATSITDRKRGERS